MNMPLSALLNSSFSVLPDDFTEQLRLKHQQRQNSQVLPLLVFSWQDYTLGLPMIAAQKVIPITATLQQQMITDLMLTWQGVNIQLVTLPLLNWETFDTRSHEEDHFILVFAVPDGRLLGLPISTLPNVVELPIRWFCPVDQDPAFQALPFSPWIQFMAVPEMEDINPTELPKVYLLDLDYLQTHNPSITHSDLSDLM